MKKRGRSFSAPWSAHHAAGTPAVLFLSAVMENGPTAGSTSDTLTRSDRQFNGDSMISKIGYVITLLL